MSENIQFGRFMEIVRRLRAKDGCPWDIEQTHESLKQNLIEEAYEAAEAINNSDMKNLCEELGDIMLLVCMQAVIGEENSEFNMEEVLKGIADKMIFRHPHVFKEKAADNITSEEVLANWEQIKAEEKHEETVGEGLLRVAKALPANVRAEKVQKKAAKTGMDFESYGQALGKVYEELKELEDARLSGDRNAVEEEFGDLMFSVINISRFLQLNAEISLTNATNKFINRFVSVERKALEGGKCLAQMSAEELDALWTSVK